MRKDSQDIPARDKGKVEVVHRAGGEASRRGKKGVPKVERIVQSGLLQKPARRRHQAADKDSSRAVLLLGIGLTILLVVGLVWYMVTRPGDDVVDVSLSASVEPKTPAPPKLSGLMSDLSPEEIVEAVKIAAKGFMNAETEGERSTWVVDGAETLEKMKEYYGREGVDAPNGFGDVLASNAVSMKGVSGEIRLVASREGEGKHWLNIFPTKGRMLIEWESSVAYGEMSWDKFLTETPTEAVQMRIHLTRESYYNYEFSDETKYQCLRVKGVNSEDSIFGYVARDSEAAIALSKMRTRSSNIPANVRMKFLPWSRDKRMVLIEEVIHLNWMNDETLTERLLAQ